MRAPFTVAALSVAILSVSAVTAEAHARLMRSDPAANAVVAAPRAINCDARGRGLVSEVLVRNY